jgi:hypothetical protein
VKISSTPVSAASGFPLFCKALLAATLASLSVWALLSLGRVQPLYRDLGPKLVRVGYIGDSIVQGNNLAAANGSSMTALANRELTWARALYPYIQIDTWIDLSDPLRHFDGSNAGFSGETPRIPTASTEVDKYGWRH